MIKFAIDELLRVQQWNLSRLQDQSAINRDVNDPKSDLKSICKTWLPVSQWVHWWPVAHIRR